MRETDQNKKTKLTGNSSGTVNEDENHAAECPSDAKNADPAADLAAVFYVGLVTVANDSENSDVQEQKRGDELGDDGSVKRPLSELVGVDQRCWWWVLVVLGSEPTGFEILRHGCCTLWVKLKKKWRKELGFESRGVAEGSDEG